MESTAVVDPLLTDAARLFENSQEGFVGKRVAPVFLSSKDSAKYYKFDAAHFLEQPDNLERSPGSNWKRVTSKLSSDSFSTTQRGIEEPIDDVERALYSDSFSADEAAIEVRTRNVMVDHESRVATAAQSASIPNSAVGANWSVSNGAAIHTDISDAKETIRKAIGTEPNLLVIPQAIWVGALERNEYIKDIIKYTQSAFLTVDLVSRALGIPIAIAKALKGTNNEGQTTTSGNIWSQNEVLMTYATPGQNFRAMNAFRTFAWDKSGFGDMVVETYREEKISSDVHRVSSYDDVKLTGSPLAYRLTGILA